MNTTGKLSAYAAALALLIAGAYGVGSAVGPPSAATAPRQPGTTTGEAAQHGDVHGGPVADAEMQPAGLASSSSGYTLIPTDPVLTPRATETFSFRITGPDGAPVTAFDVEHDEQMHLVVVRRDSTGYQHLHPELSADGTWSVPLAVLAGGSYRAFADFAPTGGEPTTLGVDLSAPGLYEPLAHTPTRTAQLDGYRVELTGDLVAGQPSPVALTVSRDGAPVTDLQPYLGAYGHLVALREGDLAYLHVHPDGAPAAGPQVSFVAEVPSAGTYRLFLDFRHGNVVRTAEFTVPAGRGH